MRTLLAALGAVLLLVAACGDDLAEAPRDAGGGQLGEVGAAAARLEGWIERLEGARLEIRSMVHTTDPPIEVEAVALVDAERLYFALQSRFTEESDAPPVLFETLSADGALYSRWYGVDGWRYTPLVRWGYYAGFTARLDAVANTSWARLDDVEVSRAEWQGRPVWLVEYEADRVDLFQYPDLISPLATGLNGSPTVLFGYESQRGEVRLWIDRESGAPLLTETRQWFAGLGEDDPTEIASTTTLRAWNAPLDMPSPEPVLAEDEYWARVSAAAAREPSLRSGSSATPLELITLAQDWLGAEDARLAQDTVVSVGGREHSARRMLGSEAAEFLSLLTPLAGYIGEAGFSGSSLGPSTQWFTVRPRRATLAGWQEEAAALVGAQLEAVDDSLPAIEAVAWLEVTLRVNDVSGAWVEAALNADVITAEGVLRLKSVIAPDPTR